MVGLEALETGFDGVHDVAAGGAYVVGAGAGAAEDLSGDDDFVAGDVQVLEGLAEGFFALAFGVDIGGVEEVDAPLKGAVDDARGRGPVHRAAERGPRPEAELRDLETRAAETAIVHGMGSGRA